MRLEISDRIHWLGHLNDRVVYLDALAACDLFVFPSPAEGFPKVVLDSMAVGLPVLATPTGSLRELAAANLIGSMRPSPGSVARAIRELVARSGRAVELREAGTAFAANHTRTAEARRLVADWRHHFPGLPWPTDA